MDVACVGLVGRGEPGLTRRRVLAGLYAIGGEAGGVIQRWDVMFAPLHPVKIVNQAHESDSCRFVLIDECFS